MAEAFAKIFLAGEDLDWTGRRCLMFALPLSTTVNISPSSDGIKIRQYGKIEQNIDLSFFQYTGSPNDYIKAGLYLWNNEVCKIKDITIDIFTMIPIAAGLGSSAALLNALFTALSDYYQIDVDICSLGYKTEHDIINAVVGSVDFYISAAKGKIMLYEALSNGVRIEFLDDTLRDIDILLLYSGNNSNTAEINKEKMRRFKAGDRDFQTYLEKTDDLVMEGYRAVGDIENLGKVVTKAHKVMSRYLKNSTSYIDDLVQLCNDFGAYGSKLTGCGKGGYVYSLIEKGKATFLCQELESRRIPYMKVTL